MDNYIGMYEKLPNLVLGFHGCDSNTYDNVLIEHMIGQKKGMDKKMLM